jgi:hypothetical protein
LNERLEIADSAAAVSVALFGQDMQYSQSLQKMQRWSFECNGTGLSWRSAA